MGALADVALYYEWDWQKAERLFQRALELNPSLAMTHYHYAWYLVLFARLDEAIAEHTLARDLDPLQAMFTGWLGDLYVYSGRYDEGIAEAKKALELDPTFRPSYQVMYNAYSGKGMHMEAIAIARRLAEMTDGAPGALSRLAAAYLKAGQREQALALAANRTPSGDWGAFYLALGDRDAVLQGMEARYKAHATMPETTAMFPWALRKHGPAYDVLHDDPRFQDLLRRMKLPW